MPLVQVVETVLQTVESSGVSLKEGDGECQGAHQCQSLWRTLNGLKRFLVEGNHLNQVLACMSVLL